MKHYKKIIFIVILFFVCGTIVQAKGTFQTDTYYKNVCGVDFIPVNLPNAISGIYSAVKSLLPVVIIILGMFDFLKAVMAGKQDEATKNTNKFIRRIISGLLVFLIMALVQFVFNRLGTINNYTNCMNCLLSNQSCGATYTVEKDTTCESYSDSECPEEVKEVTCEKIEKIGKKYCRSVCDTIKTKTQCDSRSYCKWNSSKKECADAPVYKISIKSDKTTSTGISDSGSTISGSATACNTDISNYRIVNTQVPLTEYCKKVQAKALFQSPKKEWHDKCLSFAEAYAFVMRSGNLSDVFFKSSSYANYGYAGNLRDDFYNEGSYGSLDNAKAAMLNKVYTEINLGNPVVLQVNGNKSGTGRHFVTVVGYKKSVLSSHKLDETDLLIMDSWDGKIEYMNGKGSGTRFLTRGRQTGNGSYDYYIRVLK